MPVNESFFSGAMSESHCFFLRRIEEERKTLVSDNLLEDLTSIYEPDKEESTNGITDEVPEYRSRSREEVESGSSVACPRGAGDSELLVETEIESEPHIVLARDTAVGKEDHKAVDINEKNQKDSQQIYEDSPIEHTLNLDIVTEIEASNEALGTNDFINDQTEAEDDKILGMNIKIAVDDGTVEDSVPSVSIAVEKEKVEHRKTITSEETTPVSEITTVAKLCEFESDADTLQIEVAAEQEDTEEAVKEKSRSSETGIIVLGAVMDDFDIETTDVSMTEADVNNEIDKEEEKVLGMNIRVEESKTKQVDAEKESKIYTFVDQEESHEVVSLKEKLTELEEYSCCQHGGIHKTDLLATSELKPVTKLKGEVTKDKEDETAAELEESFSRTNPAESRVPFVPNGIEEAIEIIDSETLELQKGPPINGENPTETVTDLVIGSSLAADSGRLVRDESSSAHEEESVESAPVVPPRPPQPLCTSSPHLADASNENIFGSSTEATKSTGRSRIRKPEWMRRSLVRSGSVRRLFGRMRSKRFGHDQYPVTPEPEPMPPPRPFRQMVVDFLLLLFES